MCFGVEISSTMQLTLSTIMIVVNNKEVEKPFNLLGHEWVLYQNLIHQGRNT